MSSTMWGKFDESTKAASADAEATKMPVVELRMVEANEPLASESGSAVLSRGIRSLYESKEFCDLVLVVGGKRLPAHKSILAAMSNNFREHLQQEPGAADPMQGVLTPVEAAAPVPDVLPAVADVAAAAVDAPAVTPAEAVVAVPETTVPAAPAAPVTSTLGTDVVPVDSAATTVPVPEKPHGQLELQVSGITTVESLETMLSYVYGVGTGAEWEYAPSNAEVNKDILRLARNFGLPHLHEYAARWLTKGLTTDTVVQRLVTCEEFGLMLLREKIIEQLTANPAELTVVSSSPEIMKHPRILQDLLMQVACLCGVGAKKAPAKAEKAEKAEKTEKVEKAEKADKLEKLEQLEEQSEEQMEEPEPVKKKDKDAGKSVKQLELRAKMEKVVEKLTLEPAAKKAKRSAAGA